MIKYLVLLVVICIIQILQVFGRPYEFTPREFASPPPRIIRVCCSFGSDLQLWGIPGVKVTDIISADNLGKHHYLGSDTEGNGIIYTSRGGFIDMAHLRDQADWTAFLYSHVLQSRKSGHIILDLGHEGGKKTLSLAIPSDIDSLDALQIAGRIAYDLSVWHEIATWFGASYLPMVPERYSSFSIEDIYSNLLGVTLGIVALKSDLSYQQAMTLEIAAILNELGAVKTEADTYAAMEAVRNLWWTREKKLPSHKILLAHELKPYYTMRPWLIPQQIIVGSQEYTLHVPEYTSKGETVSNFYELRFELNYKFPFRKMFPQRTSRYITQNDFETLLNLANKEIRHL